MTKRSKNKSGSEDIKSHATGFYVRGFQSLVEPTFIPLNPLTLFFGPNSAGKSAFIDAIKLLEDIAHQDVDSVWNKVATWKPVDLDTFDRSRPDLGNSSMAIGIRYIVGNDYIDALSKDTKERRNDLGLQAHLDWLRSIVGRTVHIEIDLYDRIYAPAIKVAVDCEPVVEYFPYGSEPGKFERDGHFRRADDPKYDENDYIDDEDLGRLSLFHHHDLWRDLPAIASLDDFARSPKVGAASEFIQVRNQVLEVSDVDFDCLHHQGQSFEFEAGRLLKLSLSSDKRIRNKVAAWGAPAEWSRGVTSRLISVPEETRRRLLRNIDSFLEDLGPFCRALLELGAATLQHCHVPGDRGVIRPSATSFGNHGGLDEDGHPRVSLAGLDKKSRPASAYFLPFASATAASENIKARNLLGNYDKPSVNDWILDLLPSMRNMQIRADAYRVSALQPPRGPIGSNDSGRYALRMYVVDGQQRPLEFENVGSGVSYVFPILVALWARTLSFIEQPELHLHPAAQCEVADVLIAAKNEGRVAVVESHSEHLLLRLLRRVRETSSGSLKNPKLAVSPDDIAVMYFDPQPDGTTRVRHLRVSREGDFIDRWPNGFFEERARELFGE